MCMCDNDNEYVYPVKVGDRVSHIGDGVVLGTVTHVDTNLKHITTCNVIWDDQPDEVDIQWTNKLLVV